MSDQEKAPAGGESPLDDGIYDVTFIRNGEEHTTEDLLIQNVFVGEEMHANDPRILRAVLRVSFQNCPTCGAHFDSQREATFHCAPDPLMDLKEWTRAFNDRPEDRDRLARLYPEFDRQSFPVQFARSVEDAHSAALHEDALRSRADAPRCPECGAPAKAVNVDGDRLLITCLDCDWAKCEGFSEDHESEEPRA